MISLTNNYISSKKSNINVQVLDMVSHYITRMLTIFGLERNINSSITQNVMPIVNALSKFRSMIRRIAQDKDSGMTNILSACDDFRDLDMVELGIALDDQSGKNICVLYQFNEHKMVLRLLNWLTEKSLFNKEKKRNQKKHLK